MCLLSTITAAEMVENTPLRGLEVPTPQAVTTCRNAPRLGSAARHSYGREEGGGGIQGAPLTYKMQDINLGL